MPIHSLILSLNDTTKTQYPHYHVVVNFFTHPLKISAMVDIKPLFWRVMDGVLMILN